MLIKKAVYKKVKVLQNKLVSDDVFGCDECQSVIEEYPNEENRLIVTIFYNNGETENLHFCSWDCLFKYLPKIKTDYFISLPHASYDTVNNKRSAKYLIEFIEKHFLKNSD